MVLLVVLALGHSVSYGLEHEVRVEEDPGEDNGAGGLPANLAPECYIITHCEESGELGHLESRKVVSDFCRFKRGRERRLSDFELEIIVIQSSLHN